MENFIRQNRKAVAIAVLALGIILVIVLRPGAPAAPDMAQDPAQQQPSASGDAGKAPLGIVRAGIVGTPTRMPINSGFNGRISEVHVQEGQRVKAGQPLFTLTATAAARSASAASEAPANAGASVDYNRLQKLYEQGVISRRELDNAKPRAGTPSASAGAGVPAGPVVVTAPIEGFVSGLAASAGNAVQSGERMLSLGSGQALEVVVPLAQLELYQVQPGTPATLEISGATVKGEVAGIFPEVKENAVASFLAHINLIDPPAGLLQTGMTVTVRIETGL